MLNKIEIDSQLNDGLKTEFPRSAHMHRTLGGNNLTYVSWPSVVDRLNHEFGALNWDWYLIDKWVEDSVPFKDKSGKVTEQNPTAHVIGRLVVRTLDKNGNIYTTTKEAAGCKAIIGGQDKQAEIFKAASSDAIKKAAVLLGIGLELARKEEARQYYEELNYVDPWDDTALEIYKDQLKFLDEVKSLNGYTDAEMDILVQQFFQDSNASMKWIVPDNIEEFCHYIEDWSNSAYDGSDQ